MRDFIYEHFPMLILDFDFSLLITKFPLRNVGPSHYRVHPDYHLKMKLTLEKCCIEIFKNFKPIQFLLKCKKLIQPNIPKNCGCCRLVVVFKRTFIL